MEDKNTGTEIN